MSGVRCFVPIDLEDNSAPWKSLISCRALCWRGSPSTGQREPSMRLLRLAAPCGAVLSRCQRATGEPRAKDLRRLDFGRPNELHLKSQLEKLRTVAADRASIGNPATGLQKRELFARLRGQRVVTADHSPRFCMLMMSRRNSRAAAPSICLVHLGAMALRAMSRDGHPS
jgi:hypothetical protein